MSQLYIFPPGFGTSSNASVGTNGSPIPTSSTEIGGKNGSGNLTPVSVDASGNVNVNVVTSPLPAGSATAANQVTEIDLITSKLSGSLVPVAFDEIDMTYVAAGPGTGQVATAVYKLASATVKTLTMSYDGSDRLISVVAS